MNEKNVKGNGLALIPLIVFVLIFLGSGIILNSMGVEMAFYQFPAPTAVMIGLVIAFIMFKGTIEEKFDNFVKGCGEDNIIIMCVIYILAGAFSSVATAMGGRDSFVNFGLSFVPAEFMTAGIFIVAMAMSISAGTSMGTIAALGPIAYGVGTAAGLNMPLTLAAVVGGAIFGDNLSVISDTTIAATRSQGCDMKDKFRVNAIIAIPAAITAAILMLIFGAPEVATSPEIGSFSVMKILPYIVVLVVAVIGVNVFVVLTGGIALAGIIGIMGGDISFLEFAQAIYNGMLGMMDVFLTSMLIGGLAHMVTKAGGLQFLIEKIKTMIKGQKSAEVGIGVLTVLTDLAIANNTVAIIVDGPIVKEIATKFKVDPRRSASILDIASCVAQASLPYGAHLLLVGSLSEGTVSVIEMMPYLWYQYALGIFAVASIFIPYADGVIKKNPWNWEHGMDQAKVDKLMKQTA